MDLTTKRIIVTGCASGMGAATVRAYVAAGASVIGMDVSDDAGSIVCSDAAASGPGSAAYLSADVADGDQVEAAFDAAAELMGGLDVLAHPAAIHASSDASEVTIADWDHMFAVNVRGTMLTNQAAHRHLKTAGGGAIINFGSISGRRPEPGAAAYSAARLARDGRPARSPAARRSGRTGIAESRDPSGRSRQDLGHSQAATLAAAVPGSDASRFITGQLIPVDGGQANVR